MYFFSIAVVFCLLHFSLGGDLNWEKVMDKLNGHLFEADSLLNSDSINYIDAIIADVGSSISYDNNNHFLNIYAITDVEELEKLSNFFFQFLKYLQLSMFELARKNPDVLRLNDLKSAINMDPSLCNVKRHGDWAHTSLLVVNFALLRTRLGDSMFVDRSYGFNFKDSLRPEMMDTNFAIEFIRKFLDKTLDERALNEKEKFAFKSFLFFLKRCSIMFHKCISEGFKPYYRELVRCKLLMYPHLIDGYIAFYRLNI